jgi:hypothetical protein
MTLISALFISALIAVESGGNDRAVGDNGLSHGSLQIRQEVLDDIYRLTGKRFYLHDCYQRETAIYICRTYLTHYGTVRRLGRSPTSKDLAMIWNRGPDGWRKPDKNDYWRRVRAEMQRLSLLSQHPVQRDVRNQNCAKVAGALQPKL